ncbi:hypothetical protein TWF103_000193 [Orbilia oligospora]|nr:hypothetical protein TWF103_000193 [Orbilia oligospora]
MSSSAAWPRWPSRSRLEASDISERKSSYAGKYKHPPRHLKICWLDIFVELYEYITHSFTARFRYSTVIFLIGIGLGYFISLYKTTTVPRVAPSFTHNLYPTLYTQAPSPELQSTWSEDPYFLPPLSRKRLPVVPSYNIMSTDSKTLLAANDIIAQSPMTPLFIPFGRNHLMLQQTVLSYIAAGWPRSQIYIIDNTGTMDANLRGLLSNTNPFHLDYNLYRGRYGVNIIRTPTLFSFAQLQNFMLSTAMNKGWTHYFWSHQDVVALSDEARRPYKSFYENVVSSLVSLYPTMNSAASKKEGKRWGLVWYSFDHLSLVNVAVALDTDANIGAWDTFIPYYHTDCDYYERMRLNGFSILERRVGDIYDVANHVEDPEHAFFGGGRAPATKERGPGKERPWDEEEKLESRRYKMLKRELKGFMKTKNVAGKDRNTWQDELKGGKGEPWTYDSYGFDNAWWTTASVGRVIFQKKWGTLECQPSVAGKGLRRIWNSGEDFRSGRPNTVHYDDDEEYDPDHDDDLGYPYDEDDDDDDDAENDFSSSGGDGVHDMEWDSGESGNLNAWGDTGLGMEPKSRDGSKSQPGTHPKAPLNKRAVGSN